MSGDVVKVTLSPNRKSGVSVAISDFHGSFLHNARIPLWKLILFVNEFLQSSRMHYSVMENLELGSATSVDWRSFCSEVTEKWFQSQEPISGESIEVEIDESLIVRRKYRKGRILSQVWLFATLIPLIQKHIKPGSIIYSHSWAAYKDLSSLGYHQYVVNHSENLYIRHTHTKH
uniref:ISXO2-like transposase domain-containing protein n=1 Tax=Octopus bimaculoides TaxID=37653 RepID=A0A0L8H084_OCTBM